MHLLIYKYCIYVYAYFSLYAFRNDHLNLTGDILGEKDYLGPSGISGHVDHLGLYNRLIFWTSMKKKTGEMEVGGFPLMLFL